MGSRRFPRWVMDFLRIPIRLQKRRISADVTWIGIRLRAGNRCIPASLKEEILREFEKLSKDALFKNIYPKNLLHRRRHLHLAPFQELRRPLNCGSASRIAHADSFSRGSVDGAYALDAA